MLYKATIVFIALFFGIAEAGFAQEIAKDGDALELLNNERYEEAIEELEGLISREIDNKELYYYRAVAYSNLGSLEEATSTFVNPPNMVPSPMEFIRLFGVMCDNVDAIDLAINDLTKAIELDEEYIDAYKLRALMFFFKNNLHASLADARKAYELGSPLNPQALGAIQGFALGAGVVSPEEIFGGVDRPN
jgi:tetratricopeptide (TPR) repeat protein